MDAYVTKYANLSMSACLVTLFTIACPGSKRLGKAYQEKLGKNHVGVGETGESEPVSIVFNTSFQHAYTTSF